VLDFANEVGAIQEAFAPYYEATLIEQPTDPQQIYTLRTRLMGSGYIEPAEVEAFAALFFADHAAGTEHAARARWEALVDAARARFEADGDEDGREAFRHHLASFRRFYPFLAQIVALGDPDLEKLYAYGRLLLAKLPPRDGAPVVALREDELTLTRYRLVETFRGAASLKDGTAVFVKGADALGTGSLTEEEQETLSAIVARFNERFATDFTEADWVNFRAAGEAALQDPATVDQARANPLDVFETEFERRFVDLMIDGIAARSAQGERDQATAGWLMADPEVRRMVAGIVARQVYKEARG
jgi:type I restriction enzyme, R subunit